VFKPVDFVTCVCDGINYVNEKNTVKTFSNVYNHLKSGGIFMFDVSSAYKLGKVLGNNTFTYDTEELAYIWTNKLSAAKVEISLTFFEKDGGNYRRFIEDHTQYIHTEATLKSNLTAAGFSKIETFDGYTDKTAKEKSHRITFVCGK
jgi:predicted TPR repeat methyltransferase